MNRALSELVIAALVFAAALGAYAYWYHLLAAENAHVAELAGELAEIEQNETSAQLAAQELTQLSGAQGDIQNYFVDPLNVATFLETLQSLGTSLGSSVSVVSVTASGVPHPHLDLSLTISGAFTAVMRTVGAIEYSPYDITVNTLNVSVADNSNWNAAMTLSVGTASSSPKARAAELRTIPVTPATTTATSTATTTGTSTTTTP